MTEIIDEGYTEEIVNRDDYNPEYHVTTQTRMDSDGKPHYRNRSEVWLVSKEAKDEVPPIKLYQKPMTRLAQYMDYGVRKMRKDGDVMTRVDLNRDITKAYNSIVADRFKLQYDAGGNVTRLTTDEFIGVKTSDMIDIIENRLNHEGIEYTKKDRFRGSMTKFTMENAFKELGDEMKGVMTFVNRNTGEHSLKFFGGGEVLICANGMVRSETVKKIRVIHKMEQPEVEKRMHEAMGAVLEEIEVIPRQLLRLRDMTVSKAEALELITHADIPKFMQKAITHRLEEASLQTRNGKTDWDGSMYGVYMAASYIGTHYASIHTSKNFTSDVNLDHALKLQDMSVWTRAWDEREKRLEESDAPKIAQMAN